MTKSTDNPHLHTSAAGRAGRRHATALSGSRGEAGGGSVGERLVAALPENIWVNRAIALAVLVVMLFAVFQLLSCVVNAFRGGETAEASKAGDQDAYVAQHVATALDAKVAKLPVAAGSSTGVADPWVRSGLFTTGDEGLDEFVKSYCDAHTVPGDPAESARNSFNALLHEFAYEERLSNRHPDFPSWDYDYTWQFVTDGSGNCFNNAAMMQWVLRYFGYEDASARIIFVLLQSGNWSDHGAVFVTDVYNGSRHCVVDDAMREDGWMIDADSYVYQIIDVGQELDPGSFFVKNAEEIIAPPSFWYNPAVYGDDVEQDAAAAGE